MGLTEDTINGIVSLAISVAATYPFLRDDDEGHSAAELLLSVASRVFSPATSPESSAGTGRCVRPAAFED